MIVSVVTISITLISAPRKGGFNMGLFNRYEAYSEKGNELSDEIHKIVCPLLDKWYAKGFKARDIQRIVHDTIDMHLALSRTKKAIKMRVKEREEKNGSV
jgi:hypothetical protein